MNKRLKIALLVVVLLSFGFFIRATDWSVVLASVRQVGWNFFIIFFSTFVSAWMAVLAWRYCLPGESTHVSTWQLFWIRLFGENVAILNPTSIIGGEAAKIYMLTERGVKQRAALHSIILSRAIMIITQIFMLLLATTWFLSITVLDFSVSSSVLGWIGAVLGMLALFLVLMRSSLFQKVVKKLLQRLRLLHPFHKARAFLAELWLELRAFYRGNRRSMFLAFFFCCLHWIIGSVEFYLILLFLGFKTTLAKALLVDMGVIVFKTAGAFVPGQLGVEEYGNKVMLAIIGIASSTIWITASILRRARQLCWIILGVVSYFIHLHRRPANLPS